MPIYQIDFYGHMYEEAANAEQALKQVKDNFEELCKSMIDYMQFSTPRLTNNKQEIHIVPALDLRDLIVKTNAKITEAFRIDALDRRTYEDN